MKKLPFHGDTIIEVLISIAVVSAVLGGAYASANRSLNATRQAQERGESLKLAEEQLERLKGLAKIEPQVFTETDRFFCINDDGRTWVRFADIADLHAFNTYQQCEQKPQTDPSYDGTSYFIVIERTAPGNFIVHSTWNSLSGQGDDRLELIYRLNPPTTYPPTTTTTGGTIPTDPCIADPTAPGCTEPDVNLTAESTLIDRGARTRLIWTISNGTFDSCEADNQFGANHRNWNGQLSAGDVAAGGGNERTNDMNIKPSSVRDNNQNSTTFRITCYKGTTLVKRDSVRVRVRTTTTSPPPSTGPPGGPPGVPGPGGPGAGVCGWSMHYFATHNSNGHVGGNGTGGNGGNGNGGNGETCSAGNGGNGGSSLPGGNGRPSRPSSPTAPSPPASAPG